MAPASHPLLRPVARNGADFYIHASESVFARQEQKNKLY